VLVEWAEAIRSQPHAGRGPTDAVPTEGDEDAWRDTEPLADSQVLNA
jgi:hypothetical protein